MDQEAMKKRTKQFALRVIALVQALPQSWIATVLGKQLPRCATSVGANYRAACRAKSTADFIAKLKIVEEEADEACYWLELIAAADLVKEQRLTSLKQEADELTAITVATIRTTRNRLSSSIPTSSKRESRMLNHRS